MEKKLHDLQKINDFNRFHPSIDMQCIAVIEVTWLQVLTKGECMNIRPK